MGFRVRSDIDITFQISFHLRCIQGIMVTMEAWQEEGQQAVGTTDQPPVSQAGWEEQQPGVEQDTQQLPLQVKDDKYK